MMNYPVWQIGMPAGLLIALVAVVHVFVSHFAIGGGAFLVLTEARAYKRGDDGLLQYVKRHSKFFTYLTLVFGAITGVGIWFTIGLVSPEATSSLIHTFVWGWAIEWVFFFVEITAALIYAYNWERLDRKTHMAIGWIYFAAAWLSLFIINGIITYMLTPGKWIETRNFWDGFFNQTFWPSLAIRTLMCVLLAGVFGLITAMREPDGVRERVVRLAGVWIVAGTVLMPAAAWWYFGKFPAFAKAYVAGSLTGAQHAVRGGVVFAALTLLFALVFALWKPRWMRTPVMIVMMVFAFALMGAGEYLREFVRKPWVITGYIYANDVRVSSVAEHVENGAQMKWALASSGDRVGYGRELFIAQCSKCHTVDGYRAIRGRVRGWDAAHATNMLAHVQITRGTMPPFAGNQQDREALGAYLATLGAVQYPALTDGNRVEVGKQVFAARCGSCHTIGGKMRPLDTAFKGADSEQVIGLLPVLETMNPEMPPWTGSDDEAQALAAYVVNAMNGQAKR
jgi:mono/diheme cytochrome c family protein/cytochrome bd-type quinol oxidase subunit 1